MTLAGEATTAERSAKDGSPCVLQVLPVLGWGGVERNAIDVALAVIGAGGRSIVASQGGPMERELLRAGAEHVMLPLASNRLMVMRRNAAQLAYLTGLHGVDIIHARSRAAAWSARSAARRAGARFVTTFHDAYGTANPFKRFYSAIMTKGERVIAASEFIDRQIRHHYRIPVDRIRVIQRGVDLDRFSPGRVSAERVIQLATAWRVPEDRPLIMLPARFNRWKGQELLIEALTRLQDLDFCCVLIGAEPEHTAYRRQVEARIERRGLRSHAFVLDRCNDMPAAYMLADVVVSASTRPEPFNRVISEAQAMGRPVVASSHGGTRDQVVPDATGFLYQPGDAAALAAALRRALALGTAERAELSRQAEGLVRDRFSKERMCASTLAVYGEVLGVDLRYGIGAAP